MNVLTSVLRAKSAIGGLTESGRGEFGAETVPSCASRVPRPLLQFLQFAVGEVFDPGLHPPLLGLFLRPRLWWS